MECSNYDLVIEGCVQNGKYCGAINKPLGITNATLVLYENIRQKCVWYTYKTNEPLMYWNYMVAFKNKCLRPMNPTFTTDCSNQVSFSIVKSITERL